MLSTHLDAKVLEDRGHYHQAAITVNLDHVPNDVARFESVDLDEASQDDGEVSDESESVASNKESKESGDSDYEFRVFYKTNEIEATRRAQTANLFNDIIEQKASTKDLRYSSKINIREFAPQPTQVKETKKPKKRKSGLSLFGKKVQHYENDGDTAEENDIPRPKSPTSRNSSSLMLNKAERDHLEVEIIKIIQERVKNSPERLKSPGASRKESSKKVVTPGRKLSDKMGDKLSEMV